MKARLYILISLLLVSPLFGSCNKKNDPAPKDRLTDYTAADNWLYVSSDRSKPVDIFYAYPTTYTGSEKYCAVTDEGMRTLAGKIRESNATAFEESANLFMPYFRQMNAGYLLSLPQSEQDVWMRKIPATDVINAFKYYLDHYSDGRPFILAGHSQGSNCLLYVLEYMKDKPELLDRLVCAYVIGYAVTADYLTANPSLKFAEGRNDTGVIVSWNTESPGVTETNPVLLPGCISINPITWTREETLADQSESLGARLQQADGSYKKVEHFADAKVDKTRGVVVCSTVDPEDYQSAGGIFPIGVLHGCDYPFYYYDLQKNVQDRIQAYLR